MVPTLKTFFARDIDDKRRLVLPESFPPGSKVLIEQVEENIWIVKRYQPSHGVITVAFPVVHRLRDDPQWDKVERAFSDAANRNLPEPEE